MWQINDGLFLAQLPMIIGETREENFKKHEIRKVLTVSTESIPKTKQIPNVEYMFLHMFDLRDQDILENNLLFAGMEFIIDAVAREENIVVHCVAGVSRSVTFCAAYLMHKNHWCLEKTIEFIQNIRPAAGPNSGFMEQLKIFERMDFSIDPMNYKSIKLEIPDCSSFYKQPVSAKSDCVRFKCAKCRKLIFNVLNITHSCQKYIIEPMSWLTLTSSDCNIIHTCGAKLGHFIAVGSKCTDCSTFVSPWICIDKSRIDRIGITKS